MKQNRWTKVAPFVLLLLAGVLIAVGSKRRNAAGFDQSDQHLHGVHRDWLNEMATISPSLRRAG